MGNHKYEHVNVGMNSRLDTIQAAVLNEKIKLLQNEIIKRNQIAQYYNHELNDSSLILLNFLIQTHMRGHNILYVT